MGGNQWSGGQCNTGKWFQKWFELEEVILPLLEPLNSLLLNQEACFQWVSEFLSTLTFYTSSRGLAGPSNRGYSGTQERQALQGKVTFFITNTLAGKDKQLHHGWVILLLGLPLIQQKKCGGTGLFFIFKKILRCIPFPNHGFAVEIGK